MTANEATSMQARTGWSIFHVLSDNVQEAIDAVESRVADGFLLSSGRGFRAKDFPKLCATNNLKGIAAVHPGDIDWSILTERQDLKFLDLAYADAEIDLTSQNQLESLSILCNAKIRFPPSGSSLRRLILRGYAPRCEDLSELTGYSNLEYLSLTQGELRSLRGATAQKTKDAQKMRKRCRANSS